MHNSVMSRSMAVSGAMSKYQLMNEPSTKLRADELYVIALAIDVNPSEMLEAVCGHLKKGGKLK